MRAAAGNLADGELERTAVNVHVLVLDAHRVYAHLLGHEAYAVGAVVQVGHLAVLDVSARAGHVGGHVERTAAGYLERELTQAAHLGGVGRLAVARDPLGEARGRAAHVDAEGRARHVLVGELDADQVVARLARLVRHAAAAVLVVVALDLGLARTLDGQAKSAVAFFFHLIY